MKQLYTDIKSIEVYLDEDSNFNLERELKLISIHISEKEQLLLKTDFEIFLKEGQFIVLNTFGGELLFLKETELIERIKIESINDIKKVTASVIYELEERNSVNTKYKPNAGRIESSDWNMNYIFPNFFSYKKNIQSVLLLIIGKIVKWFCEYGINNLAYMNLENDFNIDLVINGRIESFVKVEIMKSN